MAQEVLIALGIVGFLAILCLVLKHREDAERAKRLSDQRAYRRDHGLDDDDHSNSQGQQPTAQHTEESR